MNVTGAQLWENKIGSGKGMVPLGNKLFYNVGEGQYDSQGLQ